MASRRLHPDRGGRPAAGTLAAAALFGIAATSPAVAQVSGHADFVVASRYSDRGPVDERLMNAETRLLLERQFYGERGEMLDLRLLATQQFRGESAVELRQASVFLPLGRRWEISAGRQVLSWGPARFEFVNDRFAKDFESFFVGRDLEYLKAPNDAVRARSFLGSWTADLVLMPTFQPDRLPDPQRFPVLDPETGRPVADPAARPALPRDDLRNGEAHLRVDRRVGRWEVALYGYWGFAGQPQGVRQVDGSATSFHPRMAAGGLSLRGPVLAGLGWLEGAVEEIREEGAGSDPSLPPDRWLVLAGYEWSPTPTRTWTLQASAEGQLRAGTVRRTLAEVDPDHPRADPVHWRLQGAGRQSFMAERLEAEIRLFWGLAERDAHWRLRLGYDFSDEILLEAAYHGFAAEHAASRFGLLRDHDLLSLRLRYHL